MTPEYILRKSLCRQPHCFSAHVVGKGYVNRGDDPATREEYLRQYHRTAESEIENMQYAADYAEPGYSTPEKGILFANWNRFPSKATDLLERAGYAIEWSDEWSLCDDCGKAVRTSPDSYSWSNSYAIVGECSIVCLDCLADNPSDYLEELSGNENSCLTESLARRIDLTDYGYRRFNDDEYESGWHPGQTDDPKAIAKQLRSQGIDDFIFVQTEQSQFYIKFAVYVKEAEQEDL